jgi:hypothetical protein
MATLPQVTSLSQITPFSSTVNPITTPNFTYVTKFHIFLNVYKVEGNGANSIYCLLLGYPPVFSTYSGFIESGNYCSVTKRELK